MKRIKLSQGKTALVSDRDYSYLSQWTWFAYRHGQTWYARRNTRVGGKRSTVTMHRVVLGLTPGDRCETDHRDGNGLNNQRRNLRSTNHPHNQRNRRLFRNNTTGYKGVYWHKYHAKWASRIGFKGCKVHLGYFDNPVDAAKAYDAAAKRLHKRFARLNFPE